MSQVSFNNNYDSEQYQILMANFQHLIQSTQEKLSLQKQQLGSMDLSNSIPPESNQLAKMPVKPFWSAYQSPQKVMYCTCGLEDTVKRQEKDIHELNLKLQLLKPLDLNQMASDLHSRPVIHAEYLQSLLTELAQKNNELQQLRFIIQQHESETQMVQQQYLNEQSAHSETLSKLQVMHHNFNVLMFVITSSNYMMRYTISKQESSTYLMS